MDISEKELKIRRAVAEWLTENASMFRLDTYYGLDIEAELYALVRSCQEID